MQHLLKNKDITSQAMGLLFTVSNWLQARHQWMLQAKYNLIAEETLFRQTELFSFDEMLQKNLHVPELLQNNFDLQRKQLETLWAAVMHATDSSNELSQFQKLKVIEQQTRYFLQQANQIMQDLWQACSLRDPLTQTWARMSLKSSMQFHQQCTPEQTSPCLLALLNQNDFRQINHCWGHAMGDQVLVQLAKLIQNELRPYDQLFRYNSDIWLILMPVTPMHIAEEIIQKILLRISNHRFTAPDNQTFETSMSFGLAESRKNENTDDWKARADIALQLTKHLTQHDGLAPPGYILKNHHLIPTQKTANA